MNGRGSAGYAEPVYFVFLFTLFHFNETIFGASQPKLFAMFQTYPPIGGGVAGCQVVACYSPCLAQLGRGNGRHVVYRIGACLVQGDWIEGGKEAYIGNNRQVILTVTIAVRRNLDDDAYVKTRSVVADGMGILGNFAIQLVV